MSISFWQSHACQPEFRCDVAIVGAGIVGASTAYWISRLKPSKKVVLIDRGAVASGASGRNAGFLLQGATSDYVKDRAAFGPEKAKRIWNFSRENRDLIFSELDSAVIELESSGSMIVAGSPEEDFRLQECVSHLRSDGAPATYFSADLTARRLSCRGFHGSLYVPSGATLNPVAMVRHVVERADPVILEHAPVHAVEKLREDVCVETVRGEVRAQRVLVSINAWLPTLFPELAGYVRPVRAQMLAMQGSQRRWLDVPVYSHDGFYYLRQTPQGTVLAGGGRHLHEQQEVGYSDTVSDSVQQAIARYLRAHFPRLEEARIDLQWSGTMGFSPDHLPIIGDLPDVPGGIWAAGFTGHGMAYGFRFGKMLAELLLERSNPEEFDLFTSERFSLSETVDSASRHQLL